MKIARYQKDGAVAVGIVEGDDVYAASGDVFGTLTKGERVGSVGDVALDIPIVPGKIVAIGLNYAAHVTENDPTREVP
ncbi:MAG: DUF2437 domain-containing protein, partial [Thermomicrobiales bacterium]|nr:DUF2437 domain-containing protein [Thermomicrobiales bacterium]